LQTWVAWSLRRGDYDAEGGTIMSTNSMENVSPDLFALLILDLQSCLRPAKWAAGGSAQPEKYEHTEILLWTQSLLF
jgi:hypothetical protein